MAGGLNREAIALAFMFSPEFQAFMDAALGAYPQRPETALTMDVYRAAFTRLPDSGGLDYWRGTIRSAQCLSTDRNVRFGNVAGASGNLVNLFFGSGEYAARGRTNRIWTSLHKL